MVQFSHNSWRGDKTFVLPSCKDVYGSFKFRFLIWFYWSLLVFRASLKWPIAELQLLCIWGSFFNPGGCFFGCDAITSGNIKAPAYPPVECFAHHNIIMQSLLFRPDIKAQEAAAIANVATSAFFHKVFLHIPPYICISLSFCTAIQLNWQ